MGDVRERDDERSISVLDRVEAAMFANFVASLLVPFAILGSNLFGISDQEPTVLSFAVYSMLNIATLTVKGADVGKLIVGIRCLRISGEPLGLLRSIVRSVHLLAPLGYALVVAQRDAEGANDVAAIIFLVLSALSLVTLFQTKGRKSIGDLLAGSECVRVPEGSSD